LTIQTEEQLYSNQKHQSKQDTSQKRAQISKTRRGSASIRLNKHQQTRNILRLANRQQLLIRTEWRSECLKWDNSVKKTKNISFKSKKANNSVQQRQTAQY
jgi:hypothetical protein